MNTYLALFRGINVGGKHIIPMKELRSLIATQGYAHVQTYIQSGNVVFTSTAPKAKAFSEAIGDAIDVQFGFRPQILVLSGADLMKAAKANPYPEADNDPKSVHLFFLAQKPKKPDLKSLEAIRKDSESFKLIGNVFYLHAPEGIGRSKLSSGVEKVLGVSVTARNWRTVMKLLAMLEP